MALELDVPPISGVTYRLFARVVKRYFRGHFRSVMVQCVERLEQARGPMVVFGNHSSWWDPMICVLLARMFLPERKHYAPIDAKALEQYPILRKIGMFPVETSTARGAAQFLRTGEAILREGGVLWITPQGRFADTREFPLRFRPGLATLAMRVPEAVLIPLATEYTYWDERMPEALARVGEPVVLAAGLSQEAVTRHLESSLAATMMELQEASCKRDSLLFRTLLKGVRGTGGLYGWWRWLRGKRLDHTARPQ